MYRSTVNLGGVRIEFSSSDFEQLSRKTKFDDYEDIDKNRCCLIRVNVVRVRRLPTEFKTGLIKIHRNILYKKNNGVEYCVFIDSNNRGKNFAFSYDIFKENATLYVIQPHSLQYNFSLEECCLAFFNYFYEAVFYSVVLSYKQGIILHGAGVVEKKHRKGIVISGPSGCGKTTLVYRLGKLGYKIISDDCLGIRMNQEKFEFFSVPGETKGYISNVYKGGKVSLILFLVPSQEKYHKIVPISQRKVFLSLYNNLTVRLPLKEKRLQYIDICSKLASQVKGFILYHTLYDESDPLRLIEY